MAFLDDVQLWSFRGVAFAVRLQSNTEWEEWFTETTINQIDPILDSNERYIDIGGVTASSLQRLLAFNSPGERASFAGMRGTVGTLARPGISQTALFTAFQFISSGTPDYSLLSATFDAL